MNRQDIQIRLDERFPVQKKKFVFEIRFEEPTVSFGSVDRIEIGIQIKGFIAKVPVVSTSAVISGSISYDADRHEFLLANPHIKSLELDRAPDKQVEAIRTAIDSIANTYLPAIPVYRLDAKKYRLKRFLLKRAWVQDGQLFLEMGI